MKNPIRLTRQISNSQKVRAIPAIALQLWANVYRTLKRIKNLDTVGFWPVLAGLTGISLLIVLAFSRPGLSPTATTSEAIPETENWSFASPGDGAYPPPDLPEEVNFGHEEDDERAAKYRSLERQTAQIEQTLNAAERNMEKGRLVSPVGDNALANYRSVLALEPDNTDAKLGISAIQSEFIAWAEAAFADKDIDKANHLLDRAGRLRKESGRARALKREIEQHLAEKAQRTRIYQTEQARQERLVRVRRQDQEMQGSRAQRAATRRSAAAPDARTLREGIAAYYSGSYDAAFRLLNPLAENGDPRAKFRMAMMYYHGRGVVRDRNLAQTLVREALPQIRDKVAENAAWAQADLGSLYADGIELAENDDEAVRLYALAAKQGYAGAQTNLGVMYANGEGVAPSRETAVLWFRRAAAQGDHIARNNLKALGVQ